MDVPFDSKHFLSPQITHINCTVGPAGCNNLYLTPGYDSVIRASFNLISKQWMLSVCGFLGWRRHWLSILQHTALVTCFQLLQLLLLLD